MKNLFQVLLLILTLSAVSGCLPSYHYGYMGTEQAPLLNSREQGIAKYLGVSVSSGGASNENEKSACLKVNNSINYTQKWYSLAAHANVYGGYHTVEAVEEYQGKSFNYYGLAPQVSASIFIPYKRFRWGFYGSGGTFWEFGSYPDWLEKAEKDSLITIENKNKILGKICYGGAGFLQEIKCGKSEMISLQAGIINPGEYQGFIGFQFRKSAVTLGISAISDSKTLSLNYARKW